jgi:hypothetical protein
MMIGLRHSLLISVNAEQSSSPSIFSVLVENYLYTSRFVKNMIYIRKDNNITMGAV